MPHIYVVYMVYVFFKYFGGDSVVCSASVRVNKKSAVLWYLVTRVSFCKIFNNFWKLQADGYYIKNGLNV